VNFEFRIARMQYTQLSIRESEIRSKLSPAASFWLLAALFVALLFAASAPSPLYGVYQRLWNFSPITLTTIYAAYALGALIALLTTGRLSDHLGRRPVLMLGIVVQIAAMIAFIAAQDVSMLYAARTLQGVGTGIGSAAISAWLLDLQPPENARLGSVVGGIAPIAGLGTGALGSGLLVQYAPDPLHLVFWLLTILFALALAAMPLMPDRVVHAPGWLQSLSPRVSVPPAARATFATLAPSLIAIWALGGLYLSLGPSLAISLVGSDSRIAGGLIILALLGVGAVATAFVRSADPRLMVSRGSLLLIVGVGITLLAVALGSSVLLYVGSVIAGLGFGPAWSGVVRSLAPLAPPEQRGALLAVIYIITYLSFSVPTILAGIAVTYFGLLGATYGYGFIVMALAAVTTVGVSRQRLGTETSA
jgi:MFS family permease